MSQKKLLKDTAIYAIGEIAPKIIGFFLLPIYTKYLSPSDYGILSYTNAVVMFLFVLGALSLNTYVLRFYFEQKTEEDIKTLIGNIFLSIGAFNLLLFSVIYVVTPCAINYFSIQIPWKPYFQFALINNLLEGFSIIPLVLFRVKQNARLFVTLSLGKTLLQFLITFLFIVVFKYGLLGHYLGRFISLAVFFIFYWIIIYRNAIFKIDLKQLKQGLIFSLPLLPGAVAYLILSLSDRIILERHVDISELGIYNVAYILAFSLSMIVQSGYRALEPEFYKWYGKEGFFQFVSKVQSVFLFAVYSIALIIALFSQEIFKLLATDAYYSGYKLVPIILIGAIMTGQNVIFSTVITSSKKTKVVGFATFAGAFISIGFNLVLIPIWGVYAAAASSAFSYFAMNLYLFKKMEFPGKRMTTEFQALSLFILSSFGIFYILDLDLSLFSILVKIATLIATVFIFSKIFKININNIRSEIRF